MPMDNILRILTAISIIMCVTMSTLAICHCIIIMHVERYIMQRLTALHCHVVGVVAVVCPLVVLPEASRETGLGGIALHLH